MKDEVSPVVLPDGRCYFNLADLADVLEQGLLGSDGLPTEERQGWARFLRGLDRFAQQRARMERIMQGVKL